MTTVEFFEAALDLVGTTVAGVRPDKLLDPTPCSEWDMHELTNHILYELAWIPAMLEGKTIDEVGNTYDGDLVGEDPIHNWQTYASAALKSAQELQPGAVAHLSYADKPATEYLAEVSADLTVHGWDLARALGTKYPLSDDVAKAAYDATKDMLEDRPEGLFDAPKPTSHDASEAEKLIAWYGRDWNWSPTS